MSADDDTQPAMRRRNGYAHEQQPIRSRGYRLLTGILIGVVLSTSLLWAGAKMQKAARPIQFIRSDLNCSFFWPPGQDSLHPTSSREARLFARCWHKEGGQ